jgi:pimeloyl-ACP methyl ester carboxylesterase
VSCKSKRVRGAGEDFDLPRGKPRSSKIRTTSLRWRTTSRSSRTITRVPCRLRTMSNPAERPWPSRTNTFCSVLGRRSAYHAFCGCDGSTAPCASIVVVSAKAGCYSFCYISFQQSRPFRRDRKRWRLRQQRCLEVASRPAIKIGCRGLRVFCRCGGHTRRPPLEVAGQGRKWRAARNFMSHLKHASLHLVPAGHWLQLDEPQQVASGMLA